MVTQSYQNYMAVMTFNLKVYRFQIEKQQSIPTYFLDKAGCKGFHCKTL